MGEIGQDVVTLVERASVATVIRGGSTTVGRSQPHKLALTSSAAAAVLPMVCQGCKQQCVVCPQRDAKQWCTYAPANESRAPRRMSREAATFGLMSSGSRKLSNCGIVLKGYSPTRCVPQMQELRRRCK